jgi:hypothetical protein
MFRDEFYYNPRLSLFFKSPGMKFEGDGGDDGGGSDDGGVDHEGNFSEKFLEHFDEADRPTLERFQKTGLKSLGKSHVDLQRQFRSPDDYIKMINDDSSDEEKAAFHERRGVPKEAKDYPKYDIPEGLVNIQTSEEEQKYYNELFKKANLTPAQRKIMADGHYEYLDKFLGDAEAARVEAENQAFDKADMELNKVFGRAKEQRILRANAIMRHYGGEEAVASLKAENNPHMTLMLDRIAEDMAPARIAAIMGKSGPTLPTNERINQEMAKLRDEPGYFDSQHPDHKKLMERKTALSLQRTA